MISKKSKTCLVTIVLSLLIFEMVPLTVSSPALGGVIVMGSKTVNFHFDTPQIEYVDDQVYVRVNGTDLNMILENMPVLPTKLHLETFSLGTTVYVVLSSYSTVKTINLTGPLCQPTSSPVDSILQYQPTTVSLESESLVEPYPSQWFSYHEGQGIYEGERQQFLSLRAYPVRYYPTSNQLAYVEDITLKIYYSYPYSLDESDAVYDLLIISPDEFSTALQPLVDHKNSLGVRTRLVTLGDIYDQMFWHGRDEAEKIKYFIKQSIDEWGISSVLLVGGMKGQSYRWHLPVRYSHVVPWDEQEYAEPQFISDLYYADIYDSNGAFSSWDPNDNDVFAEWTGGIQENIDYYPDVYLGRLACRNLREVRIMVDKIITYESTSADPSWFNNFLVVAGDSYGDTCGFNEGELIGDEAIDLMPDFTPVTVYASDDDINRQTVNDALNPGAGFAYFCGHGSPRGWNTHYPPDGNNWTTGYDIEDMVFLRNQYKLPVTVVGGCHNAQFNVTLANFIHGLLTQRLQYFSVKAPIGAYWYNEWVPNSWAWMLTSKQGGGAIATIANTGLGTHGENDWDQNDVADYLEVLDGWLELRFLEKYGVDHQHNLGMNHGDTLTEYLHRFLGNNERMDVKMVQQWELFGDPSLQIGGYS